MTFIIIIVTTIISIIGINNANFQNKLMLNPYKITQKSEYWRFLTSGFAHENYWHLFFNMITLFFFGFSVENALDAQGLDGNLHFCLLYVLALIVSDIPTFLKYKNVSGYNSLGASGAVSAIVFAYIIFSPADKICMYIILCLPGVVWGGIYLIYSAWQAKNTQALVNHDAHFYGALCGIVYVLLVAPQAGPAFMSQISNLWQF